MFAHQRFIPQLQARKYNQSSQPKKKQDRFLHAISEIAAGVTGFSFAPHKHIIYCKSPHDVIKGKITIIAAEENADKKTNETELPGNAPLTSSKTYQQQPQPLVQLAKDLNNFEKRNEKTGADNNNNNNNNKNEVKDLSGKSYSRYIEVWRERMANWNNNNDNSNSNSNDKSSFTLKELLNDKQFGHLLQQEGLQTDKKSLSNNLRKAVKCLINQGIVEFRSDGRYHVKNLNFKTHISPLTRTGFNSLIRSWWGGSSNNKISAKMKSSKQPKQLTAKVAITKKKRPSTNLQGDDLQQSGTANNIRRNNNKNYYRFSIGPSSKEIAKYCKILKERVRDTEEGEGIFTVYDLSKDQLLKQAIRKEGLEWNDKEILTRLNEIVKILVKEKECEKLEYDRFRLKLPNKIPDKTYSASAPEILQEEKGGSFSELDVLIDNLDEFQIRPSKDLSKSFTPRYIDVLLKAVDLGAISNVFTYRDLINSASFIKSLEDAQLPNNEPYLRANIAKALKEMIKDGLARKIQKYKFEIS